MPEPLVGVIFTAIAAIVGSVAALVRQLVTDRSKTRLERTAARQDENEMLLDQYRQLAAFHKADAQAAYAELDRERQQHRADVDRLEAEVAHERGRIEKWLRDREK